MNLQSYIKEAFIFDLRAGLITAVVALPLAIAFAIASGVEPIMGLYTAIIAGILGSSFGGSRFSITGPTGAMTVIVLSTVQKFGLEGLLLAGFLAGVLQILFGVMKLGKFIKYIPVPIISGFTAGIGVVIIIGQLGNSIGMQLAPKEHTWQTVIEFFRSFSSFNILALFLTLITILLIVFLPYLTKRSKYLKMIPSSLMALIVAVSLMIILKPNIPSVGAIPFGIPTIHMLKFDFHLFTSVLPSALTIALLGAIEAMLCAVVCDAMTDTKHDSNKELISQGVCNATVPFFNAIPATAAIARSAVNIREGAKTRFSGVIHAIIILFMVLFLGEYGVFIPKAFLAGILFVVAFRMINFREFKTILKISKADFSVLMVTFLLTVFTDLVLAVQIGMFFAIVLLFLRMVEMADISSLEQYGAQHKIEYLEKHPKIRDSVSVYTIHGPFFFGAMSVFDKKINEQIPLKKPILILRMRHVPFIDSTGVVRLNTFLKERKKKKYKVYMTSISPAVRKKLFADEEFKSLMLKDNIFKSTQLAIDRIQQEYDKEHPIQAQKQP